MAHAFHRHRYPSKHQCPVVDVKEQRRVAAQATLAKTFKPTPSTVPHATTGVKKPLKKTNPKVELMKIKARAKVN
jgi:hypothetical protein